MNGVVEEIKVTIVIVGQDMVPSFLGLLHLDRTVKSWELLHQMLTNGRSQYEIFCQTQINFTFTNQMIRTSQEETFTFCNPSKHCSGQLGNDLMMP